MVKHVVVSRGTNLKSFPHLTPWGVCVCTNLRTWIADFGENSFASTTLRALRLSLEKNNFFVRPCGFNVSIVRMLEEFRTCFFHVIIFFFFKTSHFIGYHCQRKCRRNIPKTAVTHPAALEIGDTGRLSFRTWSSQTTCCTIQFFFPNEWKS